MASYEENQVVVCVDHCINKFVECATNNRTEDFKLDETLKEWAQKEGLAGNASFMKEAKALFEIEVVLRGIRERIETAGMSEDALRSRRMLFSPVYRLYHESRPLENEED